jgi:hypothetical protein
MWDSSMPRTAGATLDNDATGEVQFDKWSTNSAFARDMLHLLCFWKPEKLSPNVA